MRKRRLTYLLLALTVFAVQATGLHLHAHQSSGASASPHAKGVHLALTTDHAGDQGKHHDGDTELSPTDNGIIKKAGPDKDLVGLPFLRKAAPVLPAHRGNQIPAARTAIVGGEQAYTRPFLRAPPVPHPV
jgi:hypothetical protein